MTNQEINERVAKLCGWVASVETIEHNIGYQWTEKRTCWSFPGRGRHLRPPNYAESLDACREFESKLTGDDRSLYMDYIYLIIIQSNNNAVIGFENQWAMWNATPLQRCEAFLRLKGQWE